MRPRSLVSPHIERICVSIMLVVAVATILLAAASWLPIQKLNSSTHSLLEYQIVDIAKLNSPRFVIAYRVFNWLEGLIWMTLGGLVFQRHLRKPVNSLEPIYATMFVLFGLSDFVEASTYPLWLGLWKAENLCALLYCRSAVLRVSYPNHRVF